MNNLLNDINQTLQIIKVIGQDIVLSALFLIGILILTYLSSYPFRQHVKWFFYKRRHLLSHENQHMNKVIMHTKLKVSKNDLKIIANKDYANRLYYNEFNDLMKDLPDELEHCFKLDFNDDGNNDKFIFTFTAKRKKKK